MNTRNPAAHVKMFFFFEKVFANTLTEACSAMLGPFSPVQDVQLLSAVRRLVSVECHRRQASQLVCSPRVAGGGEAARRLHGLPARGFRLYRVQSGRDPGAFGDLGGTYNDAVHSDGQVLTRFQGAELDCFQQKNLMKSLMSRPRPLSQEIGHLAVSGGVPPTGTRLGGRAANLQLPRRR